MRNILETEGYEVIGDAGNGKDGYDLIVEKSPDVVTMDVSMPGMNGIEALRLIKEFNPRIKVVILSAEGERQMKEEAAKLGADGFVTKPYQKAEILEAIKACLQ